MTINKVANQDDVLYRSEELGPTGHFYYSIPRGFQTNTTGGGSVSSDRFGTQLQCGATSGDVAEILGFNQYGMNWIGKAVTEFIVSGWSASASPTEAMEVGNDAAYWDITNGQYVASGTTQAAGNHTNQRQGHLVITQDFNAGTTEFRRRGDVNETVTINAVENGKESLVRTVSNGTGDGNVRVGFIRQTVIPE